MNLLKPKWWVVLLLLIISVLGLLFSFQGSIGIAPPLMFRIFAVMSVILIPIYLIAALVYRLVKK